MKSCTTQAIPPSQPYQGSQDMKEIWTTEKNHSTRRSVLSKIWKSAAVVASVQASNVAPSYAGEVGAKITRAVTTSDLGVSVRRSVVKGAQVIDQLDGQWEKFSDNNGLGAERAKRDARPKPKEVPPSLPLQSDVALSILKITDDTFMDMVQQSGKIGWTDLKTKIDKVDSLVRKSFERSGLVLNDQVEKGKLLGYQKDLTAEQFSYYCYIHFKAYCDLLTESKITFNRKQFETSLGEKLLPVISPKAQEILVNSNKTMKEGIQGGFTVTDQICESLRSLGFVALAERGELDSERLSDWINDESELQFSIPIDGDITLNSQLLLQEQGFRLYPDFGRFVITAGLQQSLKALNQIVTSDEYYMDPSYNSNPDLFEVKQVLVSITIDSP